MVNQETRRAVLLQCSVQNYAWGRIGSDSTVGRIYALQSKTLLDPNAPYAELWMGTHESAPSFVLVHDSVDQISQDLVHCDRTGSHPRADLDKDKQINADGDACGGIPDVNKMNGINGHELGSGDQCVHYSNVRCDENVAGSQINGHFITHQDLMDVDSCLRESSISNGGHAASNGVRSSCCKHHKDQHKIKSSQTLIEHVDCENKIDPVQLANTDPMKRRNHQQHRIISNGSDVHLKTGSTNHADLGFTNRASAYDDGHTTSGVEGADVELQHEVLKNSISGTVSENANCNGFKPHSSTWDERLHNSAMTYKRSNNNSSPLSLKDWLSINPSLLGEKVLQRWGSDLPFLFKVLSVKKALSIQAHPDKQLAKWLHQLQPQIYKDPNHKPEMALAITHFEALCGFVNPQELGHTIASVPELQLVLGKSISDALMNVCAFESDPESAKLTLKEAFTTIMTASKDVIKHALKLLLSRLERKEECILTEKELLVIRLAKDYPDDVGVLSAFFFNYVRLDPGQALCLGANEPHAYLSGDCLECMATSDNVVRAGLTPKYIDTKTLCAMLTYKQEPPTILPGTRLDEYTRRYTPPFEEFEMDSCSVPTGHTSKFPAILGPSILIFLEGTGDMLQVYENEQVHTVVQSGDVFFIPAGIHFQVTANPESTTSLHFYRAGVNSRVLLRKCIPHPANCMSFVP